MITCPRRAEIVASLGNRIGHVDSATGFDAQFGADCSALPCIMGVRVKSHTERAVRRAHLTCLETLCYCAVLALSFLACIDPCGKPCRKRCPHQMAARRPSCLNGPAVARLDSACTSRSAEFRSDWRIAMVRTGRRSRARLIFSANADGAG